MLPERLASHTLGSKGETLLLSSWTGLREQVRWKEIPQIQGQGVVLAPVQPQPLLRWLLPAKAWGSNGPQLLVDLGIQGPAPTFAFQRRNTYFKPVTQIISIYFLGPRCYLSW